MGEVLHTPLKSISDPEALVELFWALPEKNVERISIIERLEMAAKNSQDGGREAIQRMLVSLDPDKQTEAICRSLLVPWGDWSRIYRVRGLFNAIKYIESSSTYKEKNPNTIYNLAFLYYIAYSFIRNEDGSRNTEYRDKALSLSVQSEEIFRSTHSSVLDRYVAVFGGMLMPEWRKNLSEYCASLACNIPALVHLLDNEIDKALSYINIAFDTHPTPPEVYFSMGVYFLKQGAFNPSIRMLKESLKRKGEHSAEAHYQLGRAYHKKTLYLIQSSDAVDVDPKEKKRLQKLADERIAKSMSAFQASAEEDPYFSLPYYWMGLVYLLRRDCSCDRAINMFELALQMDPDTIRRYLRRHPLMCRSANRSCTRHKLEDFVRQVALGADAAVGSGSGQ